LLKSASLNNNSNNNGNLSISLLMVIIPRRPGLAGTRMSPQFWISLELRMAAFGASNFNISTK